MKKLLLLLAVTLAVVPAKAQWTTSAPSVYLTTTTNKVGIGTTTPTTKLEVVGDGSNGTPMILRNNTSTVLALYASNAVAGTLASIQSFRSRGSYTSPSAVSADDRIGGWYGQPYIDGGYRASAGIEMYVGSNPTVNSYPAYMLFGTTPANGTTRLERMRITEGGSVGINTTTPGASYKLDVNGAINATSFYLNGTLFSGSSQWTTSGTNAYFGLAGNVGIGTTTPAHKFHVVGPATGNGLTMYAAGGGDVMLANGGSLFFDDNYSYASGNYIRPVATNTQAFFTAGTERMRITSTGKIGIGTATPNASYAMDVNGILNATGLSINGTPVSGGGSSQWTTSGSNIYYNTGTVGIATATPSASYKLDVNGAINATSFFVNGQPIAGGSQWTTSGSNAYFGLTGNVGIGSTNPDAKLTVNGKVHAKEVQVDLNIPGPDYVFDKHYKLLSLNELRNYIDKHQHLPDVPSAAEMEANGVNLSEMNMILLKKVEELTLHIINLNERLAQIEKKTKNRR